MRREFLKIIVTGIFFEAAPIQQLIFTVYKHNDRPISTKT